MTQNDGPRLLAGPFRELLLEKLRCPAKQFGLPDLFAFDKPLTTLQVCAFSHHYNGVFSVTLLYLADLLYDRLQSEGNFRHQNNIRLGSNPGVQGDPTGIAPHHLDNHHPLVSFGRGRQLVDRISRCGDSCIEPESKIASPDIVIDRLGNTDDLQTLLDQLVGDRHVAVTPHRNESVDPVLFKNLDHMVRSVLDLPASIRLLVGHLKRVPSVGGPENRAPEHGDSPHPALRQRHTRFIRIECTVTVAYSIN